MAIFTNNPIVVPATPERTYDQWWLTVLNVSAPDLNGAVSAVMGFRRFTRDENGVGYYAPSNNGDGTVFYEVQDLFGIAGQNPAVAALIENLISTVGDLAKTAGKID